MSGGVIGLSRSMSRRQSLPPNPLDDEYSNIRKSKGKFNIQDSFDFSPRGNKKKEKGRIFLLNNAAPFSKN